jgi:hypothetical protein
MNKQLITKYTKYTKYTKNIDNLTEIIDEYLKRLGIVIKKDIGKHKNKLGVFNYIGWGVIALFIFFDFVNIITMLYQINIILNIDDSMVDRVIKEQENKDPLVEIALALSNPSSTIWDEMVHENYTILRCSKKKMCCLTAILMRIIQSIISIIFYLYIGSKNRVFKGVLFMFFIYILIGLVLYFLTDFDDFDDQRMYIMCPLPNQYRKLFEF